tara:strand:- start:18375 stop:18929 length:555 start_codon:yes stop_codon:yes gene_type:complete
MATKMKKSLRTNNLGLILRKEYIPNLLTIFRIFLIFPIIILLEKKIFLFTWILLILGGITDFLDGYLAKNLNLETRIGSILDPLADKIFIIIPFLYLCVDQIIPPWSLSLIIFREFIISVLRQTKSNGMPAINLSKFKSFFQFLSLIFLFYPLKTDFIINSGLIFYWSGFILSLISLLVYLRTK